MSLLCIRLQIFKWEERKAWDVLLTAFLEEFATASASGDPGVATPVALYLLTQPYHSSSDFARKMHTWAHGALGVTSKPQIPRCLAVPQLLQPVSSQLSQLQQASLPTYISLPVKGCRFAIFHVKMAPSAPNCRRCM
jgi:hypothetical protein